MIAKYYVNPYTLIAASAAFAMCLQHVYLFFYVYNIYIYFKNIFLLMLLNHFLFQSTRLDIMCVRIVVDMYWNKTE